jgi:hypothetical protein
MNYVLLIFHIARDEFYQNKHFSISSLFISTAENIINNQLKITKLKILRITECLKVMTNPKHRSEYCEQTSILQAKTFSIFRKNICCCIPRGQ